MLNNEQLFQPVVKDSVRVDQAAVEAGIIKNTQTVPLLPPELGESIAPFVRTSILHGRSMEDPGALVLRRIELHDASCPEEDIYLSFSIKGADARLPYAASYRIEPSGVRVNGLMDASTAPRIFKISEHLRQAGVLTEWPIYFARPKKFPLEDREVDLRGFRHAIAKRYMNGMGERRVLKSESAYIPPTIGEVGFVLQALEKMEFGVLYRAMMSNFRIAEIGGVHQELVGAFIEKAIRGLQKRNPQWMSVGSELQALDAASAADQQRYLIDIFPKLFGENVARLHNADCQHGYLHSGNITLAGEIVDLDSVFSKTLWPDDPDEFNQKDIFHDLSTAMHSLAALTDFEAFDPEPNNGSFEQVLRNFFLSYFAERYLGLKQTPEDGVTSIILEYLSFVFSDAQLEGYEDPRVIDPVEIYANIDAELIDSGDPHKIFIAFYKEAKLQVAGWLKENDHNSAFVECLVSAESLALLETMKFLKINDLSILRQNHPTFTQVLF